jgi:hypothetical protein
LLEHLPIWRAAAGRQVADSVDLPGLLRTSGAGSSQEAGQRGQQEAAVVHARTVERMRTKINRRTALLGVARRRETSSTSPRRPAR